MSNLTLAGILGELGSPYKNSQGNDMKFIIFLYVIYLLGMGFGVSHAQERGIGVTPAKIEIRKGVEWPYTIPVEVFSLSSAREQFEVTFEKNGKSEISAFPGRFSLESGEKKNILVTFDRPQGKVSGFVKVATIGKEENFPTGTGIKIPFSMESDVKESPFVESITVGGERFWSPLLLGTGMILATLLLLWHFSDMVRLWILRSSKN